jgi:hypothetical protein
MVWDVRPHVLQGLDTPWVRVIEIIELGGFCMDVVDMVALRSYRPERVMADGTQIIPAEQPHSHLQQLMPIHSSRNTRMMPMVQEMNSRHISVLATIRGETTIRGLPLHKRMCQPPTSNVSGWRAARSRVGGTRSSVSLADSRPATAW